MDYELRQIENFFLTKKDPKIFYPNVNSMTPKELREIFKKKYIPKIKTKEELIKELKYKKTWKDPGIGNKEFNPVFSLKGKVLDYWEQERVNMPQRSYERYPVSRQIKNFLPGREFGEDSSANGATEQFQKYLAKHKEKFNDYLYCPSKYTKPQRFLPSILLDKEPFYVRKSSYDEFTFPKHNTFIYENRFRAKK